MSEDKTQTTTAGIVAPCPRCLQMRTKTDYITIEQGRPSGRPAEWDTDSLFGGTAHHYYCLRTMTIIGPDADLVGPKLCAKERSCYESSGF